MSHDYHLGSNSNDSEMDEDDRWLPFEDEDLPSDDEPPSDSELESKEAEEQYDEMPVIEAPPEPEKPIKKSKEEKQMEKEQKMEEAERQREEALIDQAMNEMYGEPVSHTQGAKSKGKYSAPKSKKSTKAPKAIPKKDVEQHMHLLLKVDRYRTSERFKDCLDRSRLPLDHADSMSVPELEELLTRIGVVIGNKGGNNGGMLAAGICWAAHVVESLPLTKRFMNLEGYAATLSQDEAYADICEQLAIDYCFFDNMTPEKKLVMCLGSTAMKVNGINKMKASMGIAAQNAPASAVQQPVVLNSQNIRGSAIPVYNETKLEEY